MNRKLKLHELNRVDVETFKGQEKLPVIVVLDNIRSLSNVGAVFRCADSFGIEAIYLCGITPCPPHREITKTAIGATQSVEWQHFESTAEAAKNLIEKGYTVISVEQTQRTEKLGKVDFKNQSKMAIVLGNEVEGVSQEIIDLSAFSLELEQYGTKHSLNVSVCAGIVLYELSRQLRS